MSASTTLVAVGAVAGLLLPSTPAPTVTPPSVAASTAPAPKPTPTHRASRHYRTINQLPAVWQRLAWCESRFHMRATSPSGKHHGLFQIHEGFFNAVGVNWRTATVAEQYRVARYVYNRQGATAWSCARRAGLR